MKRETHWNADNIQFHIVVSDKTDKILKAQIHFTQRVYEKILDKIVSGKVDDLAFALLNNEQFEMCFGINKNEYKVE